MNAVTKAFAACPPIARALLLLKAGAAILGDSRVKNIEAMRRALGSFQNA